MRISLLPLGFLALAVACGGETFQVADSGTGGASGGDSGTGGSVTGGSANTGGTTESGGAPGTGGEVCAEGSLEIEVTASDSPPKYCKSSCGISPATITTEFGSVLETSTNCTTSCEDCAPIACGPCGPSVPMTETFVTTWNGTQYPSSMCGAAVSCHETACTRAGKYVVKVCLPRAKDGTTAAQLECEETGEFDCKQQEISWPETKRVVFDF